MSHRSMAIPRVVGSALRWITHRFCTVLDYTQLLLAPLVTIQMDGEHPDLNGYALQDACLVIAHILCQYMGTPLGTAKALR